jgi:glycosyltransferase involved in cell wall biosynthesis
MDKISAVVITKNEEKNIERCLKSLNWVGEVIVYDSQSTDQTVSLAKKLGAVVYEGEWLGFGPTKKKATELAHYDWIISIDADEEVSPALRLEIQKKISWIESQNDPHIYYKIGFLIPRLSFFLNRWVRHGGWFPDYQLRFFHRKYSQWNSDIIHEKVVAERTEKLSSVIHHYVFKNIEHQVLTNNKYSSLQAEQMFQQGRKMNYFHFWTKPMVKFLECYVLKAGFLDGWAGLIIAKNAAYSVFLKWSKLKELYDDKK